MVFEVPSPECSLSAINFTNTIGHLLGLASIPQFSGFRAWRFQVYNQFRELIKPLTSLVFPGPSVGETAGQTALSFNGGNFEVVLSDSCRCSRQTL